MENNKEMEASDRLLALGWCEYFAQQITADESRAYTVARVGAVHKYSCLLESEAGTISAVVAGKVLHQPETNPELPVVGDWVLAKPPVGGNAVIVRCLQRRSELSRRRPVDRNALKTLAASQVLASNVDYVFIVMSLNQDLNQARLERALTLVWDSGAVPVVLLSKSDLCPAAKDVGAKIQGFAQGANVHILSCLSKIGLEEILGYFKPGITACMIGSSGTGKTTLLNTLCGTKDATRAIRVDDSRGRHATTARSLHFIPGGGMLIDTPGLREIGLLGDSDLSQTFREIADLSAACKFKDCTHHLEPGCAVREAVASGKLPQERYDHFIKLGKEQEFLESKSSAAKQQATKQKQKQLSKTIKNYFQNHQQ